jgi:hypothetical protein
MLYEEVILCFADISRFEMKPDFEKGCSLGEHPFNHRIGFMPLIDFSSLIPVIVPLPLKSFQRACYRNDYLHIYKSNRVVEIPV